MYLLYCPNVKIITIQLLSFLETCASRVSDTGDVYFVPAFTGLLSPHYMPDARG